MSSRFGRYVPFLDSTVFILSPHVDYFKEWKHKGELNAGKQTPTLANLPINSAYVFLKGVSGGSVVKNPPANAEDVCSTPGSGRSPAEGNDNRLQYSCLGNVMDRGASWATVHQVGKELT